MNERIPKVYECAGEGGTEPGESSFTADGGSSSRETFVRILGIITPVPRLGWHIPLLELKVLKQTLLSSYNSPLLPCYVPYLIPT